MRYEVRPGPEHFLPPAAASMGIRLPNPGEAIVHGYIVPEEQAMEEAARRFLSAKVPTIFPGPLVLWAWTPTAEKKANAIRHLFNTLKESEGPHQKPMLIPMPDYRPKYPKINPEVEINPNHPNLTIWPQPDRYLSLHRCSLSSSEPDAEDRPRRHKLLHDGDVRPSRTRRCDAVVPRHHAGSHHAVGKESA